MTARPRLFAVLGPLGVAALAAMVTTVSLRRGTGIADSYQQAVAVAAVLAAIPIALCTRPAWPLSIGLALAVFSGHWGTLNVPVPVDRLLLATAVVSTIARDRRARPGTLASRPIDWLLMVVSLYAVCSALLAGTLDDAGARFALIDRFSLLGFLVFFVAPRAYREDRDRDVLLGVLVGLGAYLGLTALFETVGPRALVVPGYISDPSIGLHYGRARGPFAEAAANGLALYACSVAAVIAGRTWHSPAARRLALGVAGLCLLGTLFTLTRSVWLASVGATVVVMLCARELRRYLVPAVALGFVGVLVAFAVVPNLRGQADERASDKKPLWDRKNSNAAAARMVAAKPVFGFGWGRFADSSRDYYRQAADYPLALIGSVHNVLLANAVELGLLGGGLWLMACGICVLGAVLRRGPPARRPWKLGLIAVAASYLAVALSTPLGFAFPTMLLWTWAGLAWGEDPQAS